MGIVMRGQDDRSEGMFSYIRLEKRVPADQCRASTNLSARDNHLGRFGAAGVGVLFGFLGSVSPSFWLSVMVVAGASACALLLEAAAR